jgi:hypothetical protein
MLSSLQVAASGAQTDKDCGMVKSEGQLLQELRAKHQEINVLVSEALGFGDHSTLDQNQLERIEVKVEELIDQHFEATFGGAVEFWQSPDQRFAATPIGRLLLERHEISHQILDLRDGG